MAFNLTAWEWILGAVLIALLLAFLLILNREHLSVIFGMKKPRLNIDPACPCGRPHLRSQHQNELEREMNKRTKNNGQRGLSTLSAVLCCAFSSLLAFVGAMLTVNQNMINDAVDTGFVAGLETRAEIDVNEQLEFLADNAQETVFFNGGKERGGSWTIKTANGPKIFVSFTASVPEEAVIYVRLFALAASFVNLQPTLALRLFGGDIAEAFGGMVWPAGADFSGAELIEMDLSGASL